jgi:hypothetical protein
MKPSIISKAVLGDIKESRNGSLEEFVTNEEMGAEFTEWDSLSDEALSEFEDRLSED